MKKITIEIDEETADWIQVYALTSSFSVEIAMMVEHIRNCKQYWKKYQERWEKYYT